MKEKRATLLLGGLRSEPVTREQMFVCQKSVGLALLWKCAYSLVIRNTPLSTPKLSLFQSLSGQKISLEKIFAPIKDAVSGQLSGPALYQLTFPYNPRIEEKDSEIEQRQNVVIRQIFHYARDLYDEASTSLELCERGCSVRPLNGLPYPLELSCLILPNLTDVKVGAARRVPNDLEKKRELRLLVALNKKCGKLNDCNGTRTVLVLENNDIALTSEVAVREILRRIFADDEYEINEIFLVNTHNNRILVFAAPQVWFRLAANRPCHVYRMESR